MKNAETQSLSDIDVPKVTIEVDASYHIPNLFQLNLIWSKEERAYTVVLDRRTTERLIEYEDEILNTIEFLEDGTCGYLFDGFISKCVELIQSEKLELDSKKLYSAIKLMYKTAFQSEIFLKFWPLIYSCIVKKNI